MKRPLVFFAIIFALGILCQKLLAASLVVIYLLAVLFLCLSFLKFKQQRWFGIFICCLIFLTAALLELNSTLLPKNHIVNLISNNQGIYRLKGTVIDEPAQDKNSFIIRAQELIVSDLVYRCSGIVLVRSKERIECEYGDSLLVNGRIIRINSRRVRSNFNEYLKRKGIFVVINTEGPVCLTRIGGVRKFLFKRLALRAKDSAQSVFFRYLSRPCAGIMDAMVLGEKGYVTPQVNEFMRKTGTIHILVVSGFNAGIVAFLVVLILKILHIRRRWRIVVAIPALIFYCLLTGASTPVIRATVMAIVLSSAYLFERDADIFNGLAAAALLILAISPNQLFDIGFQLSFMSVIGMVYIYPKIKLLLKQPFEYKFFAFVWDSCLVSSSAWLATSGFIIYYFGSFSPVTVLANLFVVPLATLVTLSGITLLISSIITPIFSPLFAGACEVSVSLLLGICYALSKVPGAHFMLSR